MEIETPLVPETVALAEKKVAMSLDDIIKLSKRNSNVNKWKQQRRVKNMNLNGGWRNNISKGWNYVNSLSVVRQGSIAKRRTYPKGNRFPLTTNIAHKAVSVPPLGVSSRDFNAGRMSTANQPRLIGSQVQNTFVQKRHDADDHKVENGGGNWKTLDSRFAIMKEQRKTSNKSSYGVGRNVPRMLPPWARARRFTY